MISSLDNRSAQPRPYRQRPVPYNAPGGYWFPLERPEIVKPNGDADAAPGTWSLWNKIPCGALSVRGSAFRPSESKELDVNSIIYLVGLVVVVLAVLSLIGLR